MCLFFSTFLGRVFIDFGEGAIVRQKTSNLKYTTESTTPIASMPQLGDDVIITVKEKLQDIFAEVSFYRLVSCFYEVNNNILAMF